MAKELEHTVLQENLDRELQELNKRLELKEVRNIVVLIHTCDFHQSPGIPAHLEHGAQAFFHKQAP